MKQIAKTLDNIDKNKKYLLAISGGMDSMALVKCFENKGFYFSVAHCNFNLRGEDSLKDEKFVEDYCKKNQIEFFVANFNTLKLKKNRESIEMKARELRYEFFFKLLKEKKFDYVVTAHHLNDQLETFFINFFRGSGLKGLAAMPYLNKNKVLRPFLEITKENIFSFCQENNLIWREDSSNNSLDYLRNKIRHKVIPNLESISPNFFENFSKTITIIKESNDFLQKEKEKLRDEILIEIFDGVEFWDRKKLKAENIDFILIYNLFSDYGFVNKKDIVNILYSKVGSHFFSNEYTLWVDREIFILEKNKTNAKEVEFIVEKTFLPLEIEVPIRIGFFIKKRLGNDILGLDYDKISFPLKLRKWREGDFFYPINGNGKKKVSKFLKDEKISNFQKKFIYVLETKDLDLACVIGLREDNRFKIDSNTKKIFYWKYEFRKI